MRIAAGCILSTIIAVSSPASADPPALPLANSIVGLREVLGKPLLDTVVSLNNRSAMVLENLTPQGASFSSSGRKTPGEPFDALRKRSYFSISFTTCSGANSLDAKISSIIAWQAVSPKDSKSENYQGYAAFYLQQLLQLINSPPAITNPSTLRAPRTNLVNGAVFEFVKGDTSETLSLVDDANVDPDSALYFSWQVMNTSFCPKN